MHIFKIFVSVPPPLPRAALRARRFPHENIKTLLSPPGNINMKKTAFPPPSYHPATRQACFSKQIIKNSGGI